MVVNQHHQAINTTLSHSFSLCYKPTNNQPLPSLPSLPFRTSIEVEHSKVESKSELIHVFDIVAAIGWIEKYGYKDDAKFYAWDALG